MYFKDLSDYSYYLSGGLPSVKNVGWIDSRHYFERGDVPKAVVDKLHQLIAGSAVFDAHVNKIRGIHPCNLCGERNIEVSVGSKKIYIGSSEIWVPYACADGYFASPTMIVHYIEVHGYKPPDEFIEALMAVDLDVEYSAQDAYMLAVSKV
ncbi:hypothetical protein [Pseudomonas sp. LD120]|uniref:DUF7919 family protein n=1 Tax=Pseudomonas sp. LD120 TaxID=485751 RepID=UPI001356C50C|nr:hypothetical protein [Pseudomonas sp. LD120]KAF0863508.1 hypothetical protein PLD_22905 [Pseudomonas sp. LD120]